ncbi:hypothetical protein KIH41_16955 [Litoribacter ruber]|uniref:restriction endonuclease n=1 Tax=Litoribacter ruber TaxID=702568 RepID=UPI001BDA777F|nr:restriction endonuclease [Litoribacter ruber]MBT0812979.1 hypothetical protein [Litoribacter ruber]
MQTIEITPTPEVTKDKGDSLELAVEHIFRAAKFVTERNVMMATYEVDIKATVGDRTIVVECKNYQNSNLTVRNLIHQWSSKNQLIRAHKVILVLAGVSVSNADYDLAHSLDMEIWNQDVISELFTLSLRPEELREKLLTKIALQPLTIAERYRDEIIYLVIKPMLSHIHVDHEKIYWHFNKWLRAHILTELQMEKTTREERIKHIQLFEKSKTKKGFLNITTKRKEIDYWKIVYEELKEKNILNPERQESYLVYMNDLTEEYSRQFDFFQSGDHLLKAEKLIKSRLYQAINAGEECHFHTSEGLIKAYSKSEMYVIHVPDITEKEGNILNWILTSEYFEQVNDKTQIKEYFWVTSSFNELADKVYRIFTEYFNEANLGTLKDANIK